MTGCARCLDDDAVRAWDNPRRVRRVVEDESHFTLRVEVCTACGQLFAAVFCETIDWSGGNDPQDWLLIPITFEQESTLSEATLRGLAPERYLVRSWPSDGERPLAAWRRGPVWIPRHD